MNYYMYTSTYHIKTHKKNNLSSLILKQSTMNFSKEGTIATTVTIFNQLFYKLMK